MYAVPYILGALGTKILKSVQTGEVTIASGSTSNTATIAAVTLNKTFLVFSMSNSQDWDDASIACVRGRINSTTQLTFSRNSTYGDVVIRWFIVEFTATSGVVVQRGSQTLTAASNNVTISSANLSNSFPIISWETSGTDLSAPHFVSAELTTTTNLQLKAYSSLSQIVDWQVITVPTWNVAKYTGSLTGTSLNTTITAVTLANAMLISSAVAVNSTTADGNRIPRVYFSSTTNIAAVRLDATLDFDFIYYVVTSANFLNQHYQYGMTTPAVTATQALSPNITVANSFLLMTGVDVCSACNITGNDKRASVLRIKHSINSVSQVQATKISTLDSVNFAVSVMNFFNV